MSEDLEKIALDSARGTFFLATGNTISLIISAIAVFIMARLLANLNTKDEDGRLARLLRYGILFKALSGIILFSVSLLLSDHFAVYVLNRPDYGVYIRLGSFTIIFQSIFNTAGAIFVGLDHPVYNAITTTIQALLKTVLSSLFILLGLGVIGAITGFVISSVIATIVSIGLLVIKLYKPLHSSKDDSYSIKPLRTMLSYDLPLYLSALLLGLSSQLQMIILANFSSDTTIGNFKASINFIIFLSSLTNAVVMSLLQAFSKLHKNSDRAKTFFTLANKYTALLIIPITIIFMIFSEELVQIIYSTSYQSVSLFLSLSTTSFFLVGLGRFTHGGFFNGQGETKITLKMIIVSFVVFVILAPLLTKIYNVPGLIIALLIFASIETIIGAYVAKRRFQVQPDYNKVARIYLVAFISALPALLMVHFLPLPTLPKVILSGLVYLFVYVTLIPITRVIDKPELERIIQIINNMGFLKRLMKPIISYELKLITKMER